MTARNARHDHVVMPPPREPNDPVADLAIRARAELRDSDSYRHRRPLEPQTDDSTGPAHRVAQDRRHPGSICRKCDRSYAYGHKWPVPAPKTRELRVHRCPRAEHLGLGRRGGRPCGRRRITGSRVRGRCERSRDVRDEEERRDDACDEDPGISGTVTRRFGPVLLAAVGPDGLTLRLRAVASETHLGRCVPPRGLAREQGLIGTRSSPIRIRRAEERGGPAQYAPRFPITAGSVISTIRTSRVSERFSTYSRSTARRSSNVSSPRP